jgi:hypothetical protein
MSVVCKTGLKIKHRGQEVPKDELMFISNNYILTQHAIEKIQDRHSGIDVTESIRNPMIAYYNTDGSINCAINRDEYFVIATDKFPFRIVTFKEKSWYGKDVKKKEMTDEEVKELENMLSDFI